MKIDKTNLVCCLLTALTISFTLVFRYYSSHPDFINSATVWDEVNTHGFGVMKYWLATTDSWYLSAYPIHFLLFYLFNGPAVWMFTTLSAVQVFVCALLASLIAWRITGRNTSFLLIPALCLGSGFAYLGAGLSHIFSHNSVNLYGLLCIWLYVRKDIPSLMATLLISLLSLLASISDPWYVASYLLPFLFTEIYRGIKNKKFPIINILLYLFSIIIFFSHIIQNFLHIPVDKFSIATFDIILNNTQHFFLEFGRLCNILIVDSPIPYVFSSLLIILILSYKVYRSGTPTISTFLLFMSLLGIGSSYIIGLPVKSEGSARFLVNFFYITPILLWALPFKTDKIRVVVALLFVVSSIMTHIRATNSNYDRETVSIINFMKENGLNYGYGAYWGARANTITWMSDEKVIMRPMTISPTSGMLIFDNYHPQVFTNWYTQDARNAHKASQFIALTQDGETCPTVAFCESGLRKQYGEPQRILNYAGITFWVYSSVLN